MKYLVAAHTHLHYIVGLLRISKLSEAISKLVGQTIVGFYVQA